MNPKLDRSKAYLRDGMKLFGPVNPDTGKRMLDSEHKSISSAKRRSRELMKQGNTIVTTER